MNSEFSPPLTRHDVVMWFLRVLLWTSVVGCFGASLIACAYFSPANRTVPAIFFVRNAGETFIPVLILLVFPSLLASNVLGRTARDLVVSFADVKPLIGRCLGLYLFLYALPQIVLMLGTAIVSRVNSPTASLYSVLFGSANSPEFWLILASSVIVPAISCVLGFFLAFGPAIRDNFRSH